MPELVFKVEGIRAIGEGVLLSHDSCRESITGEVVFVLQPGNRSIGLRVNDKEAYRLDMPTIKMLLEFINNNE